MRAMASSSPPLVQLVGDLYSRSLNDLSLTLQHSDTSCTPGYIVLVKRVQIVRGHVKKVLIIELDHGYAVCGLKNFRMLYWIMATNDMRYVNRTHARTDKILN